MSFAGRRDIADRIVFLWMPAVNRRGEASPTTSSFAPRKASAVRAFPFPQNALQTDRYTRI